MAEENDVVREPSELLPLALGRLVAAAVPASEWLCSSPARSEK
jgi:hypothetical protein